MKKLIVTATVVALLLVTVLLYMVTKTPDARAPSSEKVDRSAEPTARGEYLVRHVAACLGCHSKRDRNHFGSPIVGHPGGGGSCFDERWGMPGRICPSNLTPDKATGLGSWSDGEIMRAIREGVDNHNEALFPMMPYTAYRYMSDADTRATVAYLRSLKSRASEAEKSHINFPASFFITLAPKPLTGPVSAPKPGITREYGEYLATIAGCKTCHTPTDDMKRPIAGQDFAGGFEFRSPFGVVRSTNLTPHATGISAWSRETFVKKFHHFRQPEAAVEVHPGENTPMPWLEYAGMTRDDLEAIYLFLRSVPPIDHHVVVRPPADK